MSKKKGKKKQHIHKLISVLITIVLILIIVIAAFGKRIKTSIANGEDIDARWFAALIYPDKYAYETAMYDLDAYFNLTDSADIAIILQDEILEDKARLINGIPYFSLSTIKTKFTNRFYYNEEEAVLLYTTSTDVIKVNVDSGEFGYYTGSVFTETGYVPAVTVGDSLYVAADYVKLYANLSYSYYDAPNRMQVYSRWDTYKEAELIRKTQVRYQGGIKSEILCQLEAGAKVTVLEVLENWTQVRTEDGFIGYVENAKLADYMETSRQPVTDAYSPWADYGTDASDDKITMVWHQIYFNDTGSNLNGLLADTNATGIDVVSPTWFYVTSATGDFESYATKEYVDNAHAKGMQVWALVEDMTHNSEFSEYDLLASSANRQRLIDNLITQTLATGADGINVDFEKVSKDAGPHYVQFLRELAIETRKNNLILSVDDYVQNQGNLYYNLSEQGLIADYVCIMGYDEHWAGCQEAGSVASISFVEGGIQSALNSGVPASKLINGVPFYTRLWKTEGSSTSSQAIGMDAAREWMSTWGVAASWDEETCQNYATRADGTAVYQIWLEDADSIETKLTIMEGYGIAGVACWKLGFESSDIWGVINRHY